ncbi:MAG TPA: hypothetical protein VK279_04820 [Solirubrobacteraceae bacterium]|nr:hypothetical protein [Solirubrobacteraceae bacterium]
MPISIPSDTLSAAGRAAHDLGLAALLGGNLFARVAMHPALADVSDPRQRGRVVNHAWRRYGTVNAAGLAAVVAGWGAARAGEARGPLLSDPERALARVKDALVVTVAVTGLAAAVEGVRFGQSAPDGAVPLADGDDPLPETPARAARLKRVLRTVGAANLAAEAALVGVNAALSQAGFRRPPARRWLKRRF